MRRSIEQGLRAVGFEIIAVGSVDRAREALQFTRPDLLIIGSDLRSADDKPFYDRIQSEKKTSSLPMLVIQALGETSLPLPGEIIVTQPIDIQDLVQRIHVFAGLASNSPQTGVPHLNIDDRTLDTALGLDSLDVVDSEVLNQTSMSVKSKADSGEKLIGFAVSSSSDTTITKNVKHNESNQMDVHTVRESQRPSPAPGETSGLEIVRDQSAYFQHMEERAVDVPMDFSSFMDELREEVKGPAPTKPVAGSRAPVPSKPVAADSKKSDLTFTSTASNLDTVKAPPSVVSSVPSHAKVGVESFIDQFKREVEQLRNDDPLDQIISSAVTSTVRNELKWEESMETISADHARLFSRQVAHDLAEKIAEKIVSKIDPERLMVLLKEELARKKKL